MSNLSVSNLAWPQHSEGPLLNQLVRLGVRGVEIAPTRLAVWDELTTRQVAAYRTRLQDAGLVASSLQAILYGRNDLSLFGHGQSFAALVDHLRRVAEIAAALGAEVLVFGSPRNRLRGDLPIDEAWAIARERWHHLGEVVAAHGAIIGIEPVPAHYGGDFLDRWADVRRMVAEVDHPGVRVHLDTGCVALGGDVIEEAIAACEPWLAHFHAAQPDLAGFDDPAVNHAAAARALRDIGYNGWIAIEMREQPIDPVDSTIVAVKAVKQLYGL